MANYVVSDSSLTSIANAIRTKGGTSAQLAFPADFVQAIEDIETGGGENKAVFTLADFVTNSGVWTVMNRIPNTLKTGGCLHFIYTEQRNSSSNGLSVFSFGVGGLTAWTPSSSDPSLYANVESNGAKVGFYFRGVGNTSIQTHTYADENGNIDLKLYADHFVDVITGTNYNYSTAVQRWMTAIANKDYVSIGQNQSPPFVGCVITLLSLEEN